MLTAILGFVVIRNKNEKMPEKFITLKNPIIPGYFADPTIVEKDGVYYLYATTDPWGSNKLACWTTSDFQSWKFNTLNWPTKKACTSKLSNGNMIWAPSVKEYNGKFYMYVSIGSEVWCGVASNPLGPWKNALGDKPLLSFDTTMYYHVIDAEVFIDNDNQPYLYWGSGWNWINGHCFVARLNPDMCSLATVPKEVTPKNYFEAPYMIKNGGKYYLTYSDGKTIEDTYKVRYAVGDSPFGPFVEAPNSPILETDTSRKVYSPGHHTFLQLKGKNYILYHRHRLPFKTNTAYRQICMNSFEFDPNLHQIKKIIPDSTVTIPKLKNNKNEGIGKDIILVVASSEQPDYPAQNVVNDNYSTRWAPRQDDVKPWILTELNNESLVKKIILYPEYANLPYKLKIVYSIDGKSWIPVVNYMDCGIEGSPIVIPVNKSLKYVKINCNDAEVKTSFWKIVML